MPDSDLEDVAAYLILTAIVGVLAALWCLL